MKPFKLFWGERGHLGTYEITAKSNYEFAIQTIGQLRHRLLMDPVLRQPLLHLFQMVYEDDSQFTEHLKCLTPLANHVSNKTKIAAIQAQPPSDADVIEFLTDAFPDLYLQLKTFNESEVVWEETISGRGAADKEEIAINIQLMNLWLKAMSSACATTGKELSVLFIAVFLHKFWYGKGCCNSPKLGGIEEEAGEYFEKTIFGGISGCEIDKQDLHIKTVGFFKGALYYPIDCNQAAELKVSQARYF